jgi:DedD protein
MAFFKFRKNGDEQSGPSSAPESLDVLRKRARHRLIGASALVLLGVVGFPLLFDSQPRPVAVDIAIDIPDKAKAPGLTAPPASAPVAATSVSVAQAIPGLAVPAPATGVAAAPPAAPEPKVSPPPEPKPEAKAETKPAAKPEEKTQSSNKAQDLLDGKDASKPGAAAKRYAVQVGAFADDKKAHEVRTTLEKAGIKTYTQVLTHADGKRTRVRVGPWENKADADKAAEKIKKLNLPASVLEL